MITIVDIETTMDFDSKEISSPFFTNWLVFVGLRTIVPDMSMGLFFYHNSIDPTKNARQTLQDILDKTDVLVGHNLKFDLLWLRQCGFRYERNLYDTMVAEYLLARGIKKGLSLEECCARRGLDRKKSDIIQKYMKDKVSYEDIPPDIVKEYCINDVEITRQLANSQLKDMGLDWSYYEGGIYEECA